jgi:uncharacterized protein YgbK (DUF1537 family)
MNGVLPPGTLVTYYGDDYTGSAAVMEVMTFAGLPTVLFLDVPTPAQLAQFASYRGIGIAGVARSQSPEWMDEHLPAFFRALQAIGAPVSHYKVCSTFDSSPTIGSIGRAVDTGAPIIGGDWFPLVVAAPALLRYQAFGNLFAAVAGEGYRLDRHPTMSRHPITPMHEADVRRHLASQTQRRIGLVDFVALKNGEAEAQFQHQRGQGAEIIAVDVLDDATLAAAGELIWRHRGKQLFAIGSQGLEYALIAHWRAQSLLPQSETPVPARPVDRLVCVSGSCSPVNAAQIVVAEAGGFAGLAIDAAKAVDASAWENEISRAAEAALAALSDGRDPLIFTARGPDDPAVAALREAMAASGVSAGVVNDRIGAGLGRVLDRLLRTTGIKRAVIAGGDTSGHAALTLGIHALTALAPLAPGAPICNAHGDDPAHAGLEIVFKGGQAGAPDFFVAVKRGRT